jgi:hypothetical protein
MNGAIRHFAFTVLCELAGRTSRYADVIRRRADRIECWAAKRRKTGKPEPDFLC